MSCDSSGNHNLVFVLETHLWLDAFQVGVAFQNIKMSWQDTPELAEAVGHFREDFLRCMLGKKYNHNRHSFITWQYFISVIIVATILFFLINISIYVPGKDFFILYCILLHWPVWNISVYASWIHVRRRVCTVCMSVPLIICKTAKRFLLLAQDQNKVKEKK